MGAKFIWMNAVDSTTVPPASTKEALTIQEMHIFIACAHSAPISLVYDLPALYSP